MSSKVIISTIGTTTTRLFGRQGQEGQSNADNKDMIRVVKSSSSSTATLSTSNQIPESNISNNDEEEAQQQTSLSILERCCCCCCNNSMIMRKRLSIIALLLLLSFAIILIIAIVVLIIVLLFFTVVFQTTNEENNNELSSSSRRRKTTTPEYLEMKKILKSYIPDIPTNEIQDETLLWLSTNNNDNGLVLQATQQSIPDQRLLERFVLALLYKSLVVVDGDDNNNWIFNNNDSSEDSDSSLWLSNKSVCDWEKVTCDQNNDNLVGSIDLSSSRNYFLTGEIPTELGLLTSLTRLYIMNANNGLSGTIPKSEVGIH